MIGPVAQLMATIGLNTAPLEAGIAKSTGLLASTGPLALAALAGGAIVAGVGVIATKMAGDFQTGINSLATGAGENAKNLGKVSDGILQMAKDTGTSVQQLTAGMYMLSSGGFTYAKGGLDILRAAAEGAKVGMADLGTVADATDTILKNYPGVVNGASGAVNTLIATVAHGKTHMEDLASSLAMVLPTGAAAGVGLRDVMGAMATMTGIGVPAAEAATYLRQTIVALAASSSGAKKELQALGLSSIQIATDMRTKGLPAALKEITDAMLAHGIKEGSAQWLATMREIAGGSKQMQGMLDLTGAHMKSFSDNAALVGKAAKDGGKQITGWALTQKTFNLQFDRAKEVVMTLMISLGQHLLPVATKLFSWIANNAIPALQNFGKFMSSNSLGSTAFKIALIAVAGVIAGVLVAAFIGWAAAAASAAIATIAATWPIMAIGAAIALLVAGLIWAYQNITPFRNAVNLMRDELGTLFRLFGSVVLPALGRFKDMLPQVKDAFVHAFQLMRDELATLIRLFGDFLGTIGRWRDNVIKQATAMGIGFINALLGLPGKLLKLGEQLIKSLAQGINNARHFIVDAVKNVPLLGGLAGGASNLLDNTPHFATGGTMGQSGMAMVGENGPELVYLPAGARVSPNVGGGGGNGGGGSGGPLVIQLNLDGRRLAEVLLPHMTPALRNAIGNHRY